MLDRSIINLSSHPLWDTTETLKWHKQMLLIYKQIQLKRVQRGDAMWSNTKLCPFQAVYLSIFLTLHSGCTTPNCPTDCALTPCHDSDDPLKLLLAEDVCSCGLTVDRKRENRKSILTSVWPVLATYSYSNEKQMYRKRKYITGDCFPA